MRNDCICLCSTVHALHTGLSLVLGDIESRCLIRHPWNENWGYMTAIVVFHNSSFQQQP